MTISWTGFAKGNVAAALAGQRVAVDLVGVSQTVLLVIRVPMLLGSLTRRTLGGRFGPQRYKAEIAPSATWYVRLSDNVFSAHEEPVEEAVKVQVATA